MTSIKNSRIFDRAADIYDQTRPLLEPIIQHGIPAILDVIGPEAHVLEVGCGTGRISIPLLERGVDLVGCDLSKPMLSRFQQKSSSARIVRADGRMLPFPAGHFEALLTVHVMHLIPAWRDVLREFRRVLVPGGAYLNVSTWAAVGRSASGKIRDFWRSWMKANGVEAGHLGAREQAELLHELNLMGADISEVEAIRYSYPFHLREELERFSSRIYSETWDLPEGIFNASMKALYEWAAQEFGDLDQELEDSVRFFIDVARFED
jgi:ubiquinone/menaquinone biosynthesis C-methylase UbiE